MLSDMAGAQAQVLSAAQISLWCRTEATSRELDDALWKRRELVRAWGMRRTMFLLPSDELAIFARGTARRSGYNLRWAVERVGSGQKLDRLLEDVFGALERPRTRSQIADSLRSLGYTVKSKPGGGWGDSRPVPWVGVGKTMLSVGFVLHVMDARYVICSGQNVGAESTYVRADRWVPRWSDVSQEEAEDQLLVKYLRAFGPATVNDFALWMGLYVRDSKELWERAAGKVEEVDVEGWKAWALESDLMELGKTKVKRPLVRLLPNFDAFLLGHKSHRNIVDERNHKRVYRAQGWVSPVVLVDGKAVGVWSYEQRSRGLEVRVAPFGKLSGDIESQVRREASELGDFLGAKEAAISIS